MARQIKARGAKAPKVAKAFAHFQSGESPYAGARGEGAKGALTAAALIVAGFAKLGARDKSMKASGAKGNADLFRALTGARAWSYWNQTGKIADGKLTVGGLNHLNARIDQTAPTYRTSVELIRETAAAMAKGGTVKRDGEADWNFSRAVAVEIK